MRRPRRRLQPALLLLALALPVTDEATAAPATPLQELVDEVIRAWDAEEAAERAGGRLDVRVFAGVDAVSAQAFQRDGVFGIRIYGGLYRHPAMDDDGLQLVVCHELGHHFGGYPFKGEHWSSAEGQADYFATQSCARRLWQGTSAAAQDFTGRLSRQPGGDAAVAACRRSWSDADGQALCARTILAALTMLQVLGDGQEAFRADTPDPVYSPQLISGTLPSFQCRLDNLIAGALCPVPFDPTLIPGRSHPDGQASPGAAQEAMTVSCAGPGPGARPACWFPAAQ